MESITGVIAYRSRGRNGGNVRGLNGMTRHSVELSGLRPVLEDLYQTYQREEYLYSDPVEFVHRYADPWDQEGVALFSALLAMETSNRFESR